MSKVYNEQGVRVPKSREDAKRPTTVSAFLVALCAILFVACCCLAVANIRSTSESNELKATVERQERKIEQQRTDGTVGMDAMCGIHTTSGDIIRLYVMTDPDRGTQYVVSDKGGICPRDADE